MPGLALCWKHFVRSVDRGYIFFEAILKFLRSPEKAADCGRQRNSDGQPPNRIGVCNGEKHKISSMFLRFIFYGHPSC